MWVYLSENVQGVSRKTTCKNVRREEQVTTKYSDYLPACFANRPSQSHHRAPTCPGGTHTFSAATFTSALCLHFDFRPVKRPDAVGLLISAEAKDKHA